MNPFQMVVIFTYKIPLIVGMAARVSFQRQEEFTIFKETFSTSSWRPSYGLCKRL